MIPLAVLEEITGASGVAPQIEVMLPTGVRARQLTVRTLLAGMCLTQAGHRPAHLTRVHQALTALPADDQRRPGVIADWEHGPHQLTRRQAERTFGLAADALAKDQPGGLPSGTLARICGDLLEASIPEEFKDASTSLAVDWTDPESFGGAGAGGTAPAVCVYQAALIVRRAPAPGGGHGLARDRLAGGGEPAFPFSGIAGLVVGVQEVVPAQRAAPALLAQQPQRAIADRGLARRRR